jgi:hypothetical protein
MKFQLIVSTLISTACAQVCIPLGFGTTTAPFNAFFTQDLMGQQGDVEGRVAVGGNAKFTDFLIGKSYFVRMILMYRCDRPRD